MDSNHYLLHGNKIKRRDTRHWKYETSKNILHERCQIGRRDNKRRVLPSMNRGVKRNKRNQQRRWEKISITILELAKDCVKREKKVTKNIK